MYFIYKKLRKTYTVASNVRDHNWSSEDYITIFWRGSRGVICTGLTSRACGIFSLAQGDTYRDHYPTLPKISFRYLKISWIWTSKTYIWSRKIITNRFFQAGRASYGSQNFQFTKEFYSKCLSRWGNGWWRGIDTCSRPSILHIYSMYARLEPQESAPPAKRGRKK